MIDKLLELSHKSVFWLSSRPNRFRLQGARIEVIAMILTRNPSPAILLGQSPYGKIWMPPQEGVRIRESFDEALDRCLESECGINFPLNQGQRSRLLHKRSLRFVDTLELPAERQGERLIADDAVGTPMEHIRLKKKAYWMATILVKDIGQISPNPDGVELISLKWFDLGEARHNIIQTNMPLKADLLIRCFDKCVRDLFGSGGEARTKIAN